MYSEPDRGGPGEAGRPFVVRSLTREYRIFSDCPKLAPNLSFLAAEPRFAGPLQHTFRYDVEGGYPFYRVDMADRASEGDGQHVLFRLYRRLNEGLREELPHGIIYHAASVACGAARILLLGRKASGKTTLALRLLTEGFTVEGDEHVVVQGADVVARPRKLRVKETSLALAPTLADAIVASPYIHDPYGSRIYSVDPKVSGRAWRIAPAPPAHFVFIEPNHGGRSVLSPLCFERAFAALIENAIVLGASKLAVAVSLRRQLMAAQTWRLSLGDHPNAVAHLRRLATETIASSSPALSGSA